MISFKIIFEQCLLYLPLVIGAYFSISLIKVSDLSLEAAYVFGSILGARSAIFTSNLPLPISLVTVIIASLFGGFVVGLISSCLTKIARLPHLLSSILTVGLFHGINQFVLRTANLSLSAHRNPLSTTIFQSLTPEFVTLGIIGIIISVSMAFFLNSQLGYSLAIYGNNPQFFDHYHISGKYVFFVGICLANSLAGLSGYFFSQTSSFADIGSGFGIVLFCITSIVLGKTFVITKKQFSILIPIVGVTSYCTIQQLLLKVGFNLKYFTMIQSIIVLVILINKYRKISSSEKVSNNLGI